MKVVEKREPLLGMLQEEKARCLRAVKALEKEIARLPRGVLLIRRKPYKNRVYRYHYLKFREGKKSVSLHVPESRVQEITRQLELRRRHEEELDAYESRLRFLENALAGAGR